MKDPVFHVPEARGSRTGTRLLRRRTVGSLTLEAREDTIDRGLGASAVLAEDILLLHRQSARILLQELTLVAQSLPRPEVARLVLAATEPEKYDQNPPRCHDPNSNQERFHADHSQKEVT